MEGAARPEAELSPGPQGLLRPGGRCGGAVGVSREETREGSGWGIWEDSIEKAFGMSMLRGRVWGMGRLISKSEGQRLASELRETQVPFLGLEDPLEEDVATIPVFLPGESHRQRSLVGCGPYSRKESNTTEVTHWHTRAPRVCCEPNLHWRWGLGGRVSNQTLRIRLWS